MSFLLKYPSVFTKKSKINTHVCGYMLDFTHLVCLVLQSRHLITQKYCCSFFPVKIEMLCESCTSSFLFQSHVKRGGLPYLKTSFEKNCFSAWASTLNMGLINKVDMVCLSPVGYGV